MTTSTESLVERARLTEAEIKPHYFDDVGLANAATTKALWAVEPWLRAESRRCEGTAALALWDSANQLLGILEAAGLERPK